ncbi:MAG TPA: homoserine kinase [Aggregatilineales bacterium]|nr:homoserine kinase [Aggregatilineales bacterium]
MIVEVTAPATVANLGVGFDVLGLACNEPADVIRAECIPTPGVIIDAIEGDDHRLPRDPLKNTAGIAAAYVLKQLGVTEGIKLAIGKGLPLESGLGSSAASAVGAAVAVNALFGSPLSRTELLPACLEGEAAVSGRHADNVAPSLLGGITLIVGLDSVYRLPTPPDLYLALVTPAVSVPTVQARAVLPKMIPLSQMVAQTAAVGLLVTAIHRGDIALMAAAMERDGIVEPAREHLMPGLREVRAAARSAGALATVISGAGPTLCSICTSRAVANAVSLATEAVYKTLGIPAVTRVTTPSQDGATVRLVS